MLLAPREVAARSVSDAAPGREQGDGPIHGVGALQPVGEDGDPRVLGDGAVGEDRAALEPAGEARAWRSGEGRLSGVPSRAIRPRPAG